MILSRTLDAITDPERLAAVRRLGLWDTPPEPAFDRLTRLAARLLQTPVAMVTFIGAEREFRKSVVGREESPVSDRMVELAVSLCRYTVASGQTLRICDTRLVPELAGHPATHTGVIAYLGIPLLEAGGHCVGALCVTDTVPREWTAEQVGTLEDLAGAVTSELRLRGDMNARTEAEAALLGANHQLRLLADTAAHLLRSVEPAELLQRLHVQLAPNLGIDVYLLYRSGPEGQLQLDASAGVPGPLLDRLRELPGEGRGNEVPPLLLPDRGGHPDSSTEGEWADFLGASTSRCFTLRAGDRIVGGLVFASRQRSEFGDHDLATLSAVADHIAAAHEYARVTAELRQRGEAEHFLAESSQMLAASLDYETTLHNVSRLVVPHLADFSVIYLVSEKGRLRRVAANHRDQAAERLLAELDTRLGSDVAARHPFLAAVVQTGAPQLVSEVDTAWYAAFAEHPEVAATLRELSPVSVLFVPLTVRGRVLGAISLARVTEGQLYTQADLCQAEDLAQRVGLAVENAQLYQEALAAGKAKSDFLAVMSHELRTPLTAVVGYADLMEAEVSGPVNATQREQLGRIKAGAWQLVSTIDEILAFTRLESGRETLHVEPADLATLFRRTVSLVEPVASEKGVRFEAEIREPLRATTDAAKVRQIVLNLLSNAVKFTPAGGRIRMVAGADDERVMVEVHDTGIGIPVDQQEQVFNPFWQAEAANTRRTGGTGIGLSIVLRLARLLGGDVSLASAPGSGSTFRVWLPQHLEESPRPAARRRPRA